MVARVVYCAGEWNEAGMDNQTCDRHSSAQAKARVLLPSLNALYLCRHCAQTLNFGDDFFIEYETVKVGASSGD